MAIRHPESYKNVAEEIARSWSKGVGSNFVLVAPPLTDPELVFKKLRNASFQEECGLDPDGLAVAHLSQVSYRTSKEFVQLVIDMWDVDLPDSDDDYDELDKLEGAIELLEEKDRLPIILLPQFHKAVEKLSWSLGSRLRDMEMNFGLCTVVELPVPLSRLRERWELRPEKETFICSDFGQGHSMILLTGYEKDEVKALVINSGVSEDYLEKILLLSGGMPALVRWLLLEAKRAKSLNDFDAAVRRGCIEQCRRFLGWLDAPNADYYKRRISAIWHGVANEGERVAVSAHDWKDVLIDRSGHLRSEAIGSACANSIAGDYGQNISSISTAVMNENEEDQIKSLIPKDESKNLEFKQTFTLDIKSGKKEKYIEKSSLKTIGAFLNSEGGDLLIGVNDDGEITGVEIEIDKFFKNGDKYLLNFKSKLKANIGEEFYPLIDYKLIEVDGKQVLRVNCGIAGSPCFLDDAEFYVRSGPATDILDGKKQHEYIKQKF